MPRGGVAPGEHGAHELEHHQVERGLEVLGQMRLHQRGADRAQVVGETDADAGLLARLGLAVLRRLHRRGHGWAGDAAGIGASVDVAAVLGLRGGAGARGLRRLRHVFRLHQTLNDLERAVAPDGGDAARHREVLRLESGPGFDLRFDLVETGLDGVGLLDQRLGPLVLVHGGELVVAGAELLDLGLLGVGRLGGLGLDAPEARGGAPVDVRHRLGPIPTGRELVGGRLELLHGELDEQRRVLQPDPVLVLVGEQVAQHRAARGLVGRDPDEARHGRAGRHALLGQHALHLPRGRAVALSRHLLPYRALAVVIGGDRECLQRLEVDLVGAVGVEQLGRGVAEPQALLDQAFGDAEARGDGGDGGARLRELAERDHLVGRVHGDAHDVLRERELAGIAVRGDLARHRMVGIEGAVPGERLQRREAPSAGHDGIALGAVLGGIVGAGDEVLEQPVRLDGGHELGLGEFVGGGLAHVLGREREAAQRDLPDERLGRGCDVVHASLHG